MATLKDYYNTGDDWRGGITASTTRLAQTFTAGSSYAIGSIKLKLYRVGSPSTVNVAIKATDESGEPTGEDLCSGTTDGDTLTTDSGGEWREISLDDSTPISSGTKYAIVIGVPGADSSNRVYWRSKTIGAYSNGEPFNSFDSGASWTSSDPADFMFETYDGGLSKPINPTPEDEESGITLDGTTVSWENGGGATEYNVYSGTLSGFLTLVEAGVTDTSYTLRSTNWPLYGSVRYWRVDASDGVNTETGDEWYFTTLIFYPPTPSGVTWSDPGNATGYTGTPTGVNNMLTVRRLVGAANNIIWYEV